VVLRFELNWRERRIREKERKKKKKKKAPLSGSCFFFFFDPDSLFFFLSASTAAFFSRCHPQNRHSLTHAHKHKNTPLKSKTTTKTNPRKRNPIARFLARHGASLSVLLLIALALGGAAHLRQSRACGALTQRLHHDITELQNEHGHAQASGDATAQQVNALHHQLEEARRELATTRAASAERDRRLAEAEAAAHGHAINAHGASAETEALRSRADTLALSLAAAERERDEARHLLEAEKALHLKKEAEWKAAEAAAHAKGESYGGHHGDGDDDHTGFLQVAKLLEVLIFPSFGVGERREEEDTEEKREEKDESKEKTQLFFLLLSSSSPFSPPPTGSGRHPPAGPQGPGLLPGSLLRGPDGLCLGRGRARRADA